MSRFSLNPFASSDVNRHEQSETWEQISRISEKPPGDPFPGRIAFGARSVPGGHPYLVSVREITERTGGNIRSRHHCGGTLIHPNWVVSSAHCYGNRLRANDIVIRVGEYDQARQEGTEREYPVRNIIIPPTFNSFSYETDIALLNIQPGIRLARRIIETVGLPSENTRVTPNDRCFVTGWGETERGPSSVVREAQLILFNQAGQSRCRNIYAQQRFLSRSMFCAGTNTGIPSDTCLGDSGGPFICLLNGRRVLVGITSWGVMECGRSSRYPGVYTDVRVLRNWIRNNARI